MTIMMTNDGTDPEMSTLPDGTANEWRRNGQYHRDDGPAIEWFDGTKVWYRHGKMHRDDGPAYEAADGTKEWHVFGEQVTPEQFMIWRKEMLKQEQDQRDAARKALMTAIEASLELQAPVRIRKALSFSKQPAPR